MDLSMVSLRLLVSLSSMFFSSLSLSLLRVAVIHCSMFFNSCRRSIPNILVQISMQSSSMVGVSLLVSGALLQVGLFLFSSVFALGSPVGCRCLLFVIGFLLSASLLRSLNDIPAFWHSSMKVPQAG